MNNFTWSENKIGNHIKAARLLGEIKDEVFEFIRNRKEVNEYEVQEFILSKFEEKGLTMDKDKDPPIVAFGENTKEVHYFASKDKSRFLKEGDLILIDIWGRVDEENSPYADITWMGVKGEMDEEKRKSFNMVIEARDLALDFIRNELKKKRVPLGKEVDDIARDFFEKKDVKERFLHGLGHSLGDDHPHGIYPYLNSRSVIPELLINLGYTIEPGLYFQDYGIRSEIDFYINDMDELVVTTEIQRDIVGV